VSCYRRSEDDHGRRLFLRHLLKRLVQSRNKDVLITLTTLLFVFLLKLQHKKSQQQQRFNQIFLCLRKLW